MAFRRLFLSFEATPRTERRSLNRGQRPGKAEPFRKGVGGAEGGYSSNTHFGEGVAAAALGEGADTGVPFGIGVP